MDPNVLASQALALLSPYLARAGDSAAQTVGAAAAKQAETILAAIRRRFGIDRDVYAEQTLDKVIEEPRQESPKQALEAILANKAKQDTSFYAELEQLMQEAKRDPSTQQFLLKIYGGEVGKIFQIGSVQTLNVGDREQSQ